ncbi:hypothetical protein BDV26DRAFT_300685 [Aspergillus bertholletiae]|uniref:FAD-binding domain-containing protein n=1 Tax=Aspergillus bertholletiae TaxID=1226010 RepID=A0A5N7AVV5_9EURO|nr:hypothetical protein BDV26DRAFT_300685 [Aspergillus bertholletiae]
MENLSAKELERFEVIIIGFSVAGLTLANALSRRKVDYVVLEAQKGLPAPFTGNALTLLPNGARVLSQLGVLEDIEAASQPIRSHSTWLANGYLIKTVDMMQLPSTRHGYDSVVIARWDLIQILYNKLLGDRSRVVFNKRAIDFDQSSSGVKVKCTDGSSYTGNIVVGADGVHSVTRKEVLWRRQDISRTLGSVQYGSLILTSEYSGIYGISNPISELHPGQAHRTYGNGFSFIINVGKHGRIYWLLSIKAKETSPYLHLSRYAQDQASIDQHVRPFLNVHISSNVLFRDLYYNTKTCLHVGLEELLSENWVSGNIVCIGDSVHKMTPNLAQGANCAIESAASLANCLMRIRNKRQGCIFDKCSYEARLRSWEASRKHRMKFFYACSWILARCESFRGTLFKALGLYIGSYHGEQVISYISDIDGRAEYLDFLPEPPRVSKAVLCVEHGNLFRLNYFVVKTAFALLDSSLRLWQLCSQPGEANRC